MSSIDAQVGDQTKQSSPAFQVRNQKRLVTITVNLSTLD